MNPRHERTRGSWAVAALAGILVITASWWALALWPLPADTPEWLVRARTACFGSTRDTLPHGGGWVLLVGQPLGMVGFLLAVWGDAVAHGLGTLWRAWPGRAVLAGSLGLLLIGLWAAFARVAGARGEPFDPASGTLRPAAPMALTDPAPRLDLVDQYGTVVSLDAYRGRTVLVTFAFAHCETVCPLLVRDALRAAERTTPPPTVLVVTLDPWRDTPSRLPGMAAGWELPGYARVLGGAVDSVERALSAWKVPRIRNRSTGDLIHPAMTYVVGPDGRLAWLTDGSASALGQALGGME